MFSLEELERYIGENASLKYSIENYLLESRVGQEMELDPEIIPDLIYFSSAVMGSIATNDMTDESKWREISRFTADIEYALFLFETSSNKSDESGKNHLVRAALLYEFADYPGITALMAKEEYFDKNLLNFFTRNRESGFGRLEIDWTADGNSTKGIDFRQNPLFSIIDEVVGLVESFMQNFNAEELVYVEKALDIIKDLGLLYNFELNADEVIIFKKVIRNRYNSSVSRYVPKNILTNLRKAGISSELWRTQIDAIDGGLLDDQYKSWGLATPTGTGKTTIAHILIINFIKQNPGQKVFYIVPSRALASQVANELINTLEPLGVKVGALGSHLTYHSALGNPNDMDVLIFTPEKADLILRIEPEIIKNTRLVIIDEAHHIEAGTRGILLEFYLWRLRALVQSDCRIVQLSAVAPNIDELVGWLGEENSTKYVKKDWKPTRFRIGVYEKHEDVGIISFDKYKDISFASTEFGEKYKSVSDDIIEIGNIAHALSKQGVVLILASSKKNAEDISRYIEHLRKDFLKNDRIVELTYSMVSLDAKLERELYSEVPLRSHISFGVAYHHSGLPSRVRWAVEQVIKEKKVNVVCSTTTLAEGVNFPFSTVIVQSLVVGRNAVLSPRELWNIAGRAGRFGVDIEGHCILYKPSNYMKKITNYTLEDYMVTTLDSIPPVKSALAESLNELYLVLRDNKINIDDIKSVQLEELKKKLKGEKGSNIRGMINMVRVGLTHAHSSGLIDLNVDQDRSIFDEMFAFSQVNEETKELSNVIEKVQRKVLSDYLLHDEKLMKIAAKMGWAIETQKNLWDWVTGLDDWQTSGFGKIVRYGQVYESGKLKYLLGPVAKLMTEFNGKNLGGYTAHIAENWIMGLPLTEIRSRYIKEKKKETTFEILIDMIYSRIQYLLPWALYGVNDLLEYEAQKRNISYESGIKDLSILSSEGVPNFNALMLCMNLNIERVDATRLSEVYQKGSKAIPIEEWFKGLKWNEVERLIKGVDQRRIDPDLKELHSMV